MNRRTHLTACFVLTLAVLGACAEPAGAAGTNPDLARQLVNPLASLISVPLQMNRDEGIGPRHVARTTLNLQPVVPISLGVGARCRLISRTTLPIVRQSGGGLPGAELSCLGDLTQSLFITPSAGTGGWLLGAGPVLQFPTGEEPGLGTGHFSLGPTVIALRQAGPWTYGALANHLWSVAGDGGRGPVSTSFVQPFLAFVAPTHTTLAINTEASYDWQTPAWSVPLHLTLSQLLKLGALPFSAFVGARYWFESPELGPEGWGIRAGLTLLFPKGRVL